MSSTAENRRCETCRFYVLSDSCGRRCRRYAPRPALATEPWATDSPEPFAIHYAVWPYVNWDDFCGEYEERS